MMEMLEELTSFVDNEIRDNNLRQHLAELILTDNRIKYEYLVQEEIKKLLGKRFSFCCTPKCVCENVIDRLYKELNSNISNKQI